MTKPPFCWDDTQSWVEWNRFNDQLPVGAGKAPDHYCADCNPEYQSKMISEGRCAFPAATFVALVERRRDPSTGKVVVLRTSNYRGRRSPADEALWLKQHVGHVTELGKDLGY
jgi:hypothetical protein